MVSPPAAPKRPAAFLSANRRSEAHRTAPLLGEVFLELPPPPMPVPSPLARAVATRPAARAPGCLDKPQRRRSVRARVSDKGPRSGATLPRPRPRDSALDSRQVSASLCLVSHQLTLQINWGDLIQDFYNLYYIIVFVLVQIIVLMSLIPQ